MEKKERKYMNGMKTCSRKPLVVNTKIYSLNSPQAAILHSNLGLSLQVGASSNLFKTSKPSTTWLKQKEEKKCMQFKHLS